jgi:predicted XRE-type DNA-binding protein
MEITNPLVEDNSFESRLNLIFFGDILQENLKVVQEDVDFLWNNCFIVLFDYYAKNPQIVYDKIIVNKQDFSYITISSNILPSQKAKQTHIKKPIEIIFGCFKDGNQYITFEKNNEIRFTLDIDAINILGSDGLKNKAAINAYPELEERFSEMSIKASISHELTHWIGDAEHNLKLINYLKQTKKHTNDKTLNYFEMDAYVNSIAEMKNHIPDNVWNNMTFLDLIMKKNALVAMLKKVQKLPLKRVEIWNKAFFERLSREKLLGKNMEPLSLKQLSNLKI